MSLSTDTMILDLIARNALFVINHSGGKDSQAMTIKVRELVPASQIVVVHAELPGVDWDGIGEHIEATVGDLPVVYCRAVKTFVEMVEARGMFPSPKYRQCTSDLKRGPIEKAVRALVKANPAFGGLVVNCTGIRADESANRSKANPFKLSEKNSVAGRTWYEWLPIFEMSTDEVWETIHGAGQVGHWAYDAGMTRLSCCFCIMSSKADLNTAARLRPELFREINALERRIGHTMMMPAKGQDARFLDEIVEAPQANLTAAAGSDLTPLRPTGPLGANAMTIQPHEVLVLMPCGGDKLDRPAQLLDLYVGPMWQTLRTHLGAIPQRNVFVLSAKHGLRSVLEVRAPYDQRMTKVRADQLVALGIHQPEQVIRNNQAIDINNRPAILLRNRTDTPYRAVIIAGAGEYLRVMEAYLAELISAGIVGNCAHTFTVEGGIGEQRGQLGRWLRALQPALAA